MSVLPLFGADDSTPAAKPDAEPDSAPAPAAAPAAAAPVAQHVPPSPPAASQSLYRKYRPQSFDADDLVGQEHVVRTLRNAIRLGRIAHAYLFCGPRGTGKTTTARLVAKAVNCLDPDPDKRPCNACENCLAISRGTATDVIEIDAASNRGIDDIRDLRERVKYAPTQLPYKFYIVDEAHQITGAAANAFLKTLEEPPAHTKFVLATTDPEELLPTIVSRCQRFDFRRISHDAMVSRLRTVATDEGIAIDDAALDEIARHATGSLRDALGLLDQLALHGGESSDDPVGAEDVRALLGISRNDRVLNLMRALADRDPASALATVNDAVDAGDDPRQLNRQLVAALRAAMHDVAASRPGDPSAPHLDLPRLAALLRRFSEVDYRIRHSPYAHLPLEIALVEATAGVAAPAVASPAERSDTHASAPSRSTGEPAIDPGAPTNRLRARVRGDAAPAAPLPSRPASREPERTQFGSDTGRRDEPRPEPRQDVPRPSQPPAGPLDRQSARPTTVPSPTASVAEPTGNGHGGDATSVGQLADLWPRIRQDVKALNRRAEALLTEADPARVSGNRITLATPYEFHRDKINSDNVRELLETVIGRLVGRDVSVEAALAADIARSPAPAPRPAAPAPIPVEAAEPEAAAPSVRLVPPAPDMEPRPAEPAPSPLDDPERADERIDIARNIFDADPIDD